jgi:1-deoxy-D-xylulose-5-phosphate reductoisomerase
MKIAVLGSTGSIGLQTLDICRRLSPRPKIAILSARSSGDVLMAQASEFDSQYAVLSDREAWEQAKTSAGKTSVLFGDEGLEEALAAAKPDIVVNAVWGTAGLNASLNAIRHSHRLALANKESIVCAGELVMAEARERNCEILPIDSEQSAIFQALQAGNHNEIRRIILTASGGPFREWTPERIEKATPEDALKHPTWEMGSGITVDSATLMNKAFEVIEAKWLFDLDPAQIEVVIHPESIVHSMVEFVDGSCIAQLSLTDMRIPIQYALTYPERMELGLKHLDLGELGSLNFEKPDTKRFAALALAWEVLELGGTAGAALVAANQQASRAFLDGRTDFNSISKISAHVIKSLSVIDNPTFENILATQEWARTEADRCISQGF